MKGGQLVCHTILVLEPQQPGVGFKEPRRRGSYHGQLQEMPLGSSAGRCVAGGLRRGRYVQRGIDDIDDRNRFVTDAAMATYVDTITGQLVALHAIGSTATSNTRNNAPKRYRSTISRAGPEVQFMSTREREPAPAKDPIDVTESMDLLWRGLAWCGSIAMEQVGPISHCAPTSPRLLGHVARVLPTCLSQSSEPSSIVCQIRVPSGPVTRQGPSPSADSIPGQIG